MWTKWRLIERGFSVYDPAGVYWTDEHDAAIIWRSNQAMIDVSVGLMGLLPPGVKTIGTIMEIEYAREHEKRVVVVGEEKGSWQLKGAGIPVYSFRHLETAIEAFIQWRY